MALTDKKILVTGGSGFVGTNLLKRLVEMGCAPRATWHNKQPQLMTEAIEYCRADLLRPEDCRLIMQDVDYVFICSAQTSGAAVIEKTPLVHVTPNVIMNTQLLDAAYSAHVEKVMFLSSNTVYPVTDWPVKEDEAHGTLFEKYFCVGWMKRFSEILCEMYAKKIKQPMQVLVVRPGNIYGEYDDFEWETAHVIPSLIRKVVERHQPIEVWGDGSEQKDFIYVGDFVEGILCAMEKMSSFDPINIAGGQSYTVKEVIETICRVDGCESWPIVYDPSKPTMIPKRLIDVSKARELLGFSPSVALADGLKRTIEWYRKTHTV